MVDESVEVIKLEIGRLEVRPGELLVIRASREMAGDEMAGFMQALQGVIPEGVRCFLCGPEFEFEVVGKDDDNFRRGLLMAAKALE